MTKFPASNDGQGLWEVIIALAIAGLVAVGLVRATSTSIKSSRFSADQSQLTALAQQKIASIVDYKNKNYQTFWSGSSYFPDGLPGNTRQEPSAAGDYCLFTIITDVSGQLLTTTPGYTEAKMVQINVKVFWDEKGAGAQCNGLDFNHSLNFDTYVTN